MTSNQNRPETSGETQSSANPASPPQSVTASSMSSFEPTAITTPPQNSAAASSASHTVVLQPEEGTVLGVYRLEKKLGEGGMGAVWKAFHTRLKKYVALKVLPAHLLRDASVVARFDREMEAVGRLDHPAIVRAMDAGEVQGTHYLVMEYVEGQDLGQLVKAKGARSVRDACEIIRQAAIGLAYAHKNGLVHRDIKPSNLFLTKDGKVKILDLGLARLQGDSAGPDLGAGLTGTGQILGTPDYMAPEQWENTHTVGPACDLYALGCTLFFLLTGRAPFADDKHQTFPRKMLGHVSEAPPELSTVRSELLKRAKRPGKSSASADPGTPAPTHDIPDEVEAIYRKLMAKEPAERYPSAEALALALQSWLKAKPDAAVPAATPSVTSSSLNAAPSQTAFSEFELIAAQATGATQAVTVPVAKPRKPVAPPLEGKGAGTGNRWKKWTLLGGAGAVLLLGVIVITIRHKDGTTSKIKLKPGESADIREEPETAEPTPAPTSRARDDSAGWRGWPADAPKPAIAPFDAAQAKRHQEAWAKYLNVPLEYTNSIGMKFRLIPPGEFDMGSSPDEIEAARSHLREFIGSNWDAELSSEGPRHRVILTQPVYVGMHEVTQAQYAEITKTSPSHFSRGSVSSEWAKRLEGINTGPHPVDSVTWSQAAEFCRKLTKREMSVYGESVAPRPGALRYRLPTEAEWEFSCRAGTTTKYWTGDSEKSVESAGWFPPQSGMRTHAVGELAANPFGIFDIHGNVSEWVLDNWHADWFGRFSETAAIDPIGATIARQRKVLRGGNCSSHSMWEGRSGFRHAYEPSGFHWHSLGFRAALSVDLVRALRKAEGPAIPKRVVHTAKGMDSETDYDAERRAAEWIVQQRNGGAIIETIEGVRLGLVSHGAKDLPEEDFVISEIFLGNCDITDEGLNELSRCRHLRVVNLRENGRLTHKGLEAIRHNRHLRYLGLVNTRLDSQYVPLLNAWPELESLYTEVSRDAMDDAAIQQIAPHPSLKTVSISSNEHVTDAGIEALSASCPNIEELGIAGHDLRSATLRSLKAIRGFQKLKHVECSGSQLTDEGLAVLQKMPDLESLTIGSPVYDDGIHRLGNSGLRLKSLTLSTWTHSDQPSEKPYLPNLKNVRFERLKFWGVEGSPTDVDLLELATRSELKSLWLSFGVDGPPGFPDNKRQYTDAGIAALRRLRPDLDMEIDGRRYPPLRVYPKSEGGVAVADWKLPPNAPSAAIAPFAPEDAAKLQQAWADFLKQPVEVENSLGMKFRLLPPGEVETRLQEDQREPGHGIPVRFRLSQPYYLGATEVTVGQFRKFIEESGYKTSAEFPQAEVRVTTPHDYAEGQDNRWDRPGIFPARDDEPVTLVSRADATAFCEWLSKKEKLTYRLPTEAEWFQASHAGGDKRYGFVDTVDEIREYEWDRSQVAFPLTENQGPLHAVSRRKPNPFGLYDMLGNVAELVRDRLPIDLARVSSIDPVGESQPFASYCGGSWRWNYGDFTFSPRTRGWNDVTSSSSWGHIGFRVLRELPGARPLPTSKPLEAVQLIQPGSPLSPQAVVSRPSKIEGLRSWSVEMATHHGFALAAIAWSRSGDTIATAYDQDPGIRLWNTDGKLLRVLLGHSGQITDLSFSHDGKLLASCERVASDRSNQSTIRVWDVATGVTRVVLTNAGWNSCVGFAPDRYELAFNRPNGGLGLIDLTTNRTRDFRGPGVQSLSWAPDGQSLVSGNEDGEVTLWRLGDGSVVQRLRVEDPVRGTSSLAWSPDNKRVAEWRWDQKVRLWDASTGTRIRDIPTKFREVGRLFWSRDNRRLLLAGRGSPAWTLLDSIEGATLLEAEQGPVSQFTAWNPAESEVVGWNQHGSGQLLFFDATTGKVSRRGQEFGQSLRTWLEATSPDGGSVTLTSGSSVRTFETETGRLARTSNMDGGLGATVTWSPDGRLQAIPMDDAGANVLAIVETTGERRQTLRVPEAKPDERQFNRVDWSPDSRRITTSSEDGRVRIWNVEEGRLSKELTGHQGRVWNVSWSPDGTKIASAGVDKSVRIWDAERGELLIALTEFPEEPLRYYGERWSTHNLAWSSDSRSLWIGLARHAVRYDLNGRRFETLQPLSNGNSLNTFSVSPDGTQLLGQEEYGWTVLRDLNTSQSRPVAQFLGFHPIWLPDSRRFLGDDWYTASVRGFDTRTDRRLGTLYPFIGSNGRYDHWLCIGPTGHYHGSEGIDEHIVYVALHEDGRQLTYTPAEFREKFGWKNDPAKAALMKLSE